MRRVALVTGAAGSLGNACAKRLLAAGLSVVSSDIRNAAAPPSGSKESSFVHMDVCDEASVAACFDAVETRFGPISVLVCCAGGTTVTKEKQPSIAQTELSDWIKTEAVNARGTFLCVREMIRRRMTIPVQHGRIILTSSTAAQRPAVAAGAAYSAAKSAILGFARTAALEVAALDMTLNVIAPGGFDTDAYHVATDQAQMLRQIAGIPLGRLGRPEEFAALVHFLASIDAGYLTGATIDLNGGSRMI
jgi:3-oxoacyl-[acyl-carrier protein] reductase